MRAPALMLVVAITSPAWGQESAPPDETSDPPKERVILDILAPPLEETDALTTEECEREQDAARIRGEILVCRDLDGGEGAPGFDKSDWERRYGERTQGPKAPELDGLANGPVYRTDGSVVMVTTKVKTGKPPPPALIIDIEALPEAPPGSDAERAAKGLPPLEDD